MRKLVFGLSLLLGACSDGGKLAELAAKFGIGGAAKDCSSTVAAEAATPPKAAADEATTTRAPALQPEQGLAKAPDVLPPPTSAEGRRLARMAANAEASAAAQPKQPAASEATTTETAAAAEAAPAPRHRHQAAAEAVPVAVSHREPVDRDARYNHFSESTPPSEYRLPVNAQVLVPRPGQTVLNGPHQEGVPPPNSDPVRISQS